LLAAFATRADAHAASREVLPLGPQLTAKSNRTGWRLERAREQEVVSTSRQRGLFTAVFRHSVPWRVLARLLHFRRKSLRSVTAVSGWNQSACLAGCGAL